MLAPLLHTHVLWMGLEFVMPADAPDEDSDESPPDALEVQDSLCGRLLDVDATAATAGTVSAPKVADTAVSFAGNGPMGDDFPLAAARSAAPLSDGARPQRCDILRL